MKCAPETRATSATDNDPQTAEDTAHVLIKFGAEHHVREFRSRGILHMSRLQYFSSKEEDGGPLRYDRWEGVDVVIQPGKGSISIDGRHFELAGPGLLRLGGPPTPHVFCAYALTDRRAKVAVEDGRCVVDGRVAGMGTHAVVILDVPGFLERVERTLQGMSLGYRYGLVEYVSDQHSGDLGAFRKRDSYGYQSEFRLAVNGYPDDIFRAEVGSLEDISTLAEAKHAVELEVTFG